MPLLGPGGRATSDEKVIGDHAWRLLKSFNFDSKELRGIGIHIQKLESSSSSISEQGQATLSSFRAKRVPVEGDEPVFRNAFDKADSGW
jgi:DNA repair protein REV1